jgi:hypothetical protein
MNPERLYRQSVQCWKRHGTAERNPELLAKMDEVLDKAHFGGSGALIGRELADLLKCLNQLVQEDHPDFHGDVPASRSPEGSGGAKP